MVLTYFITLIPQGDEFYLEITDKELRQGQELKLPLDPCIKVIQGLYQINCHLLHAPIKDNIFLEFCKLHLK